MNGEEVVDRTTEHIRTIIETLGGQLQPEAIGATALGPNIDRSTEHPAAFYDPELFEALVGSFDLPPLELTGKYDERHRIVLDVHLTLAQMRERARRVAESEGITVSDADLATWQPSAAEFIKLRRDLERQRKMMTMIRGTEAFVNDLETESRRSGVPMRAHQRNTIIDFEEFLVEAPRDEHGGKSGLIDLPTGVGKTTIFANIAAALKHDEDPDDPVKILVLVPTKTILEQTVGWRGERGFGKFAPHLDVGAYYQDEKDLGRQVTVMCNASYNRLCAEGKVPPHDVLIVDEADTVMGETTGKNIREHGKGKIMVGLTATPETADGRSASELFTHPISRMELVDAIHGGLLAPTRAWIRRVEPQIDWSTLPTEPGPRRAAIRAAWLKACKEDAVKLIMEEVERGVGVLVHCPPGDDIDHAVKYASHLRDKLVRDPGATGHRWLRAAFVGGTHRRQKKKQRRTILELFDEGEVDAVTYNEAVGRGFDNPHVKAHVDLVPGRRTRQHKGRALRLSFGRDGKPIEAHLIDYEDPELGDEQETGVSILGVKDGELVDHDPGEAIMPQPRRGGGQKYRAHADLVGVVATTVAEAALSHEVEPAPPGEAEIEASVSRMSGAPVDRAEACRILGISPVTYNQILAGLGSSPSNPIRYADLHAIRDLYPGLQAPALPEDGEYVHAVKAVHDSPITARAFSVISYGRTRGMHPHRFTGPDGKVGYYFKRDVMQQLLSDYQQRDIVV
jgi:superfamily II DNA or RNA helicase